MTNFSRFTGSCCCGLVVALSLPDACQAKVVWATNFEGLTDIHGMAGTNGILNQPDGVINLLDVNFNGDDKPDGRRIGSQGANQVNIVPRTGPLGTSTNVIQLLVADPRNNVLGDGDDQDVRFRIENVPGGDSAPPRAGFLPFSVDDEALTGQNNFEFTKYRVSYYQNVLATGTSGVFGRGMAIRRGGTGPSIHPVSGANLVNVGFNTQIGGGSAIGLTNPARDEQNRTLNFGIGAGRAPGEPTENANDAFGYVDPIGMVLAAPTTDKNGDGQVTPFPAPFYLQNDTQSGGATLPKDAPDVVSQWHNFGAFNPSNPSANNTGGWVRVDVLIDADADRTPNTGTPRGNPSTAENFVTVSLTHMASGDTVTETRRIYSDDVQLRFSDTVMGLQFSHGIDLFGTESWFDDIKAEALLYGDINADDVINSLDIDTLYASQLGSVNSVDMKIADLDYDGVVGLVPLSGGDIDELVQTILGKSFGDVNLDGMVDSTDRGTVVANQGQNGLGWAGGDLNGDGTVNGLDLAFFAPAVQGDYNQDGTVNAADYTLWRDSVGQTVFAGTQADGSGNGTIDAADYNLWVTRFGMTSATVAGAAVPEPASVVVMLITLMAAGQVLRRKVA